MSKLLQLPFNIDINIEPNGVARLTSQLRRELVDDEIGESDPVGSAGTHAIECFLLALAAAGVDLDAPAAHEAIETAVESVASQVL